MIVSGVKILAIDGVEHDFTLSGDGVKTPIGITEELLEKIRDVSGKLDTTDFETWSGQTEHWDVQEYSGGEGIKVENHLISVSAKYLTSGDLEPYATQQWVEDQKYITSAFLEPYAQTEWVQEELAKKVDATDMTSGTFTKVTVNNQGAVVSGGSLAENDVPDISAEKLTHGYLPPDRLKDNSIQAEKLELRRRLRVDGVTVGAQTDDNAVILNAIPGLSRLVYNPTAELTTVDTSAVVVPGGGNVQEGLFVPYPGEEYDIGLVNTVSGTSCTIQKCEGIAALLNNLSLQSGGANIYPTLQDAISDAANLSVGDIFETNGFHTSGDGGAARYLVSSTGTANGMDIVSMGSGKLAVLQISDGTGTPEQFGYNRWNQDDLTPVMNRMQTAHIRNIVLSPLESGDNFPYLMKTTFTPGPAVRISSRFNFNTGASGRIWFVPSSYRTSNTPMFQLTSRGFGIKDVVLMNRPWFTEGDKHNCVCFRMAISGTGNMWYEFERLAIQGFDVGILHENVTGQDSSGLIWHCTFKKLQMALNNVNVYLRNVNYLTKFENCFFTCNDSGARSIVLEETFSTEFERCNFGIYNPAITVIDFKDYLVTNKAVDRRFSQAKFTNCNFELESDDSHPLPTEAKGFFLRFEDHDEFTVELDNCCFIITPLVRNNIYGCRPIKLGARTRFKISNSSGPYADVNYSGNEFYGWDYCKRMFDETKPPMREVGSLIIQHCVGIIPPPNNQWGSIYLPTIKTDEMTCPQSDDNTDFLNNYPDAKDGVLLLNLDKANIEAKIGSSIVQVTAPASGKVRIGDRIYDYVTIDGRKWITANLRLWTMGTRQWHYPDHDEYGFYYPVQSFSEIDALLPTGWRRPTNNDFNSLISQGYAALQATGQTAFPSATNSSGFSALPSQRWKKPNTTHTFTNCFLWGKDQGNGYSALRITPTAVSIAGWTYSDINSASDPVYVPMRVCADA